MHVETSDRLVPVSVKPVAVAQGVIVCCGCCMPLSLLPCGFGETCAHGLFVYRVIDRNGHLPVIPVRHDLRSHPKTTRVM